MLFSARSLRRFTSVSQLVAYAVVLILLPACGPVVFSDKAKEESKRISCDIDPAQADTLNSTAINLFIDGTPSMAGYTAQPNSLYVQTLKQLDSTLATGGNKPLSRDPNFYRLGKTASGDAFEKISRQQSRDAQLNKFYGGAGYESLAVSQIDSAVLPLNEGNELTVIVTDLYQANDDITAISSQIKKHHFSSASSNPTVGVVGFLGEFNGPVYVEEISGTRKFDWDQKHPFYVILIGQQSDVEYYTSQIIDKLSPGEENVKATIFSPKLAYESALVLNIFKNNQALKERLEERPLEGDPTLAALLNTLTVPAISMKQGSVVAEVYQSPIQMIELLGSGQKPISLPSEAAIEQTSPYTLGIDIEEQKLSAQMSPYTFNSNEATILASEDTVLASAVSIDDWKLAKGSLSFAANIDASKIQTPGIYLYKAAITVNSKVGSTLQPLPEAWDAWDAPIGSSDGARTVNLLPFLRELKSLTEQTIQNDPPVLGQLCYLIQKN